MSNDANVLVRYSHNADPSHATEVVKFHDDDRPDLQIGQAGYVTEDELARAGSLGVILTPTEESELEELGIELPTEPEHEKALADMNGKELEAVAEAEGVDLSGRRTNAEKAEAIQEHRSGVTEGRASLPATADRGAGAPVVPAQSAATGSSSGAPPSGSGNQGGAAS